MASVLVRMSIKSPSMRLYSSESTYHTSAHCGELASSGCIRGPIGEQVPEAALREERQRAGY